MMQNLDDTIAAIASAAGGAARGIVRITGPRTIDVIDACIRCDQLDLRRITRATALAGTMTVPGLRNELAIELLLWPDARSYTGQPAAELHMPGSPPIVQAVLGAVCRVGCRPAGPGEFTLRAVLNGRLDFTQAEAVLGVIDARGERELRAAVDQLAGGVGAPLRQLRHDLLDTLAHLEAGLDFVEEDISFVTHAALSQQIAAALAELERLSVRFAARDTTIDRPRVALVGRPNAGKSSLFNALLGSAAAIVSPIAGTTRDYLSATLALGELDCELIDTAGADSGVGESTIEQAAQRSTQRQSSQADITILCLDATDASDLESRSEARQFSTSVTLWVWTKGDCVLNFAPATSHFSQAFATSETLQFVTSARSGAGLDALRSALRSVLGQQQRSDVPTVATTAIRCRHSLASAIECLTAAARLLANNEGEELIAAEMRMALDAIGEMVGAVWTDDILDRIFSRFCIGK